MSDITIKDIQETRTRIDPYVVETPVWQWRGREIQQVVGEETEVFLKLELFQHTGTFKPRGAVNNMLALDEAALKRGVTAVSAGNHAIATAYAAQIVGSDAHVVMPKTANKFRVAKSRSYGAHVELVDDVHLAFERVNQLEAEGRTFVHPFEGRNTALGTATVGYEFCQQVADLDAVIVPIGGGGLCAGIATAVKLMQPNCKVYGVEPTGADSMTRSFASGKPESIDKVRTIADSLGAPYALPYTFGLCYEYVDEIVLVSDDELRRGMKRIYDGTKLAVEPAGAAATAALCGPLLDQLRGQRVGVIVCGTNISVDSFAEEVGKVEEA